jgi:hypothetical protein
MTNARIAAKGEQAAREMDLEANRQGTEQAYAGLRGNAEMGLRNSRTGAMLNSEGQRMEGAQAYSGLRANSEMALGDRRVDSGFRQEGMRIGAEQGVTDRNMEAERVAGNNAIAAEQGIQRANTGVAQYNQETGIGLAERADNAGTQRAASIAGNRQDVNTYNQGQQWARGTGINDRQTQRYGIIADRRLGDQQEARQWATGQQTQANNNVNLGIDQRLRNYGTQTGTMQNSTQTQAQYDLGRRGQGFRSNFMSGFGRTLGATAGGGNRGNG